MLRRAFPMKWKKQRPDCRGVRSERVVQNGMHGSETCLGRTPVGKKKTRRAWQPALGQEKRVE